MKSNVYTRPGDGRRHFIGGSDARIIMGADEAAAANHQADLLISSRADVLVTQAALDAGKLTIGTDRKTQIPIGITDGHGRVVGNGQFRTWYTGTGGSLLMISEISGHQPTSLETYVQRLHDAMGRL